MTDVTPPWPDPPRRPAMVVNVFAFAPFPSRPGDYVWGVRFPYDAQTVKAFKDALKVNRARFVNAKRNIRVAGGWLPNVTCWFVELDALEPVMQLVAADIARNVKVVQVAAPDGIPNTAVAPGSPVPSLGGTIEYIAKTSPNQKQTVVVEGGWIEPIPVAPPQSQPAPPLPVDRRYQSLQVALFNAKALKMKLVLTLDPMEIAPPGRDQSKEFRALLPHIDLFWDILSIIDLQGMVERAVEARIPQAPPQDSRRPGPYRGRRINPRTEEVLDVAIPDPIRRAR